MYREAATLAGREYYHRCIWSKRKTSFRWGFVIISQSVQEMHVLAAQRGQDDPCPHVVGGGPEVYIRPEITMMSLSQVSSPFNHPQKAVISRARPNVEHPLKVR